MSDHGTPPSRKPSSGAERRARLAEQRKAEARRERRITLLQRGGMVLGGLAVLGGIVYLVVRDSGSSGGTKSKDTVTSVPAQPRLTSEGRTTPPPWSAPSDVTAAVQAAGLPMLSSEGSVEHIHAHLDVFANGGRISVPAEIGIDATAGQISPLHTHDTSGVIHIESPVQADFSMGQFMTSWQVSVAADHLGSFKTDATHTLTAYVNGKAVTGDPSAIIFKAHDEIALVYGTAADNAKITVPGSYKWPSDL